MITDARAATTLAVSVVLHDSPLRVLEACLVHLADSLALAQDAGVLAGAEITLRDNRSTDAYRCALQALVDGLRATAPSWQQWRLQFSDSNPGFGAGHNAALVDTAAEALLVLNPDVDLHRDALLRGLAFLAGEPGVVALNPRCWRGDGRREYLCKRYPSLTDLLLRGFAGARLRERFDVRLARYEYRDCADDSASIGDGREAAGLVPTDVELLSGACLLCRRDAFEAVGGFDERFFLYFEDFDLSLRLAPHGRLCCLPAMQVVHHGGFAARKGWRHRRLFAASAWRFFGAHGWRLW